MAGMTVQVTPIGGPQKEAKTPDRPPPVSVPGFWTAFPRLASAQWLRVRNEDEEGLMAQMQAEVTNLGLILALFSTMFLPLYYDEASRINIPDDAFTFDVAHGVLAPLLLSDTFIHDFMDVCYCGALSCGALGTVAAVFMSMAINECGSDSGALVLIRKIGILMHAPYYLFTASVCFFGIGVWTHFFLIPRTILGIVLKLTITCSCLSYLMIFFSYIVQVIPKDVVRERLEAYLRETEDGRTIRGFLWTLQPVTDRGYRVPLDAITRTHAVTLYFQMLSETVGIPVGTLVQLKEELNC